MRFGLDRVWWLVSPGNPLKTDGPAPMERRITAARQMMQHPRVDISDVEARLGTRATADTLRALTRARPDLRFVWLMGADNLAQFHLWQDWEQIVEMVPVGVLARPGQRLSARMSVTARRFAAARLPGTASRLLPLKAPPAWCFVNVPMREHSSTAIRALGGWPRGEN